MNNKKVQKFYLPKEATYAKWTQLRKQVQENGNITAQKRKW